MKTNGVFTQKKVCSTKKNMLTQGKKPHSFSYKSMSYKAKEAYSASYAHRLKIHVKFGYTMWKTLFMEPQNMVILARVSTYRSNNSNVFSEFKRRACRNQYLNGAPPPRMTPRHSLNLGGSGLYLTSLVFPHPKFDNRRVKTHHLE